MDTLQAHNGPNSPLQVQSTHHILQAQSAKFSLILKICDFSLFHLFFHHRSRACSLKVSYLPYGTCPLLLKDPFINRFAKCFKFDSQLPQGPASLFEPSHFTSGKLQPHSSLISPPTPCPLASRSIDQKVFRMLLTSRYSSSKQGSCECPSNRSYLLSPLVKIDSFPPYRDSPKLYRQAED